MVPPFFVCDASWSEENILAKIDSELPNIQYFAVRSSAENEDSKDLSFAGYFYSAIGVAKEKVFSEVVKVNNSFGKMYGSVIVQEFIPSDTAGVMFTEASDNRVVINSTIGLCRPVVDGHACDEYISDKDGNLLTKTIATRKDIMLFRDGNIISQRSNSESLTKDALKYLICLAVKIQTFFGSPQDVEWCFVNGKLYVLQSRPITRQLNLKVEEYFDSANIAESYSGIVLPLTCSFARIVYEQVYKDLLRMSGVSAKEIDRHKNVFENLLGFFYGRMYYNMNNWYNLAAFVPGYQRNKENFESMITSNIKHKVATPIKPSLTFKVLYPFIVTIKFCAFGLTSWYFKRVARKEISRLRDHDFARLSYEECVQLFENLEQNLLRRWYVTVENDFLVMTYLGILKKLLDEQTLQKVITFESKATEQVSALASLSKEMQTIEPLWKAIEFSDIKTFNRELSQNLEIASLLRIYLINFGGRFANELKLESVGIDEDITKLFSVLKAYSNYKPSIYIPHSEIPLPFFKKIAMRFILGSFKKYSSRREEFRLLRSNTFAIARRIFRRMGNVLAVSGVILNADDIFYLRIEEILDPSAVKNQELIRLVEERKQEYASYENMTPPTHFVTINNLPPPSARSFSAVFTSENAIIRARPASPGIIRGRVKVFKDFFMPANIDFDIIVTSHTDPGWISLIALSKGLIIEHGGVLSHASIVARELRIPAVIGATNAVNYLKDNQVVEIDGSTGIIRII